uniref:Uncharacterized protein n=1 Tax=Leersia perrieri TaxID=77586 RepID=A0A0D9VKV0_9ORYZ
MATAEVSVRRFTGVMGEPAVEEGSITEPMAEMALGEGTMTKTKRDGVKAKGKAALPAALQLRPLKGPVVAGGGKGLSAEAAADAAKIAGGEGEQKLSVKVPMPEDYILTIMSLKREPSLSHLDHLLPEKSEEETRFAARYKKVFDKLEKMQAEIREGIDENGCYLVDESYLVESAACQAKIKEEWAKLDWEGSGIEFGEWDYSDPQCVKYL